MLESFDSLPMVVKLMIGIPVLLGLRVLVPWILRGGPWGDPER